MAAAAAAMAIRVLHLPAAQGAAAVAPEAWSVHLVQVRRAMLEALLGVAILVAVVAVLVQPVPRPLPPLAVLVEPVSHPLLPGLL